MDRPEAVTALLCLFCAAVASWQYLTITFPACADCLQVLGDIAAGTAPAPFVYRPIVPALVVALGNTRLAAGLVMLVLLFVFFRLLWAWAERWRASGAAAVALATVALGLMWPTFYFSVYSVSEWCLWLGGLLLLTRRSSPWAPPTGR